MAVILYHNPQCSKSRAALAWLQAAGHDVEVVAYAQATWSVAQLAHLQRLLNLPSPALMMRQDDDLFRQLNLQVASSDALLQALAAHPMLLQRPIAVYGNRAIIARPSEKLADLFA